MCIEKVPAFRYAGKLYHEEPDAIRAALADIGEKLKRDHHADPAKGMLENCDKIAMLLMRYRRLSRRAIPTEATSESLTGEPMGGPNG